MYLKLDKVEETSGKTVKTLYHYNDTLIIVFNDETFIEFESRHDYECSSCIEVNYSRGRISPLYVELEIATQEEYEIFCKEDKERRELDNLNREKLAYERLKAKFESDLQIRI